MFRLGTAYRGLPKVIFYCQKVIIYRRLVNISPQSDNLLHNILIYAISISIVVKTSARIGGEANFNI